jgi:copper(I)-binding protein
MLSVAGLLGPGVVAGCGDGDGDAGSATAASTAAVTVVDAWSRQPAVGQDMGVVYAVVENHTDEAVRLVSASTPVTPDVELHRTEIDDAGAMTMVEQPDGFEIAAGGTLALEPGGNHIMLMAIDPATFPTDVVDVTLQFDGADPVTIEAEVRAIADDATMGSMASTSSMAGG